MLEKYIFNTDMDGYSWKDKVLQANTQIIIIIFNDLFTISAFFSA